MDRANRIIKRRLKKILMEECNHNTLTKFMMEYKTGEMLPLRFLRLMTYLTRNECYYNLDEQIRETVDMCLETGIIKRDES